MLLPHVVHQYAVLEHPYGFACIAVALNTWIVTNAAQPLSCFAEVLANTCIVQVAGSLCHTNVISS
jgi:hypothetical protein